jgi:tetratricopeptide (TPR) repeat protein
LPEGRPDLYLEDMARSWGTFAIGLLLAALLLGLLVALPARAQNTQDDAAAREYFERGRAAFEQADYEGALVYFRHAYRLSRRGELQYNIGVAADRLQREDEALEAFERYLEETESPTREAEVRERIQALRRSIAERSATERALEEAKVRYDDGAAEAAATDGVRIKRSAIAGASALAAAGVAGIAAMSIGLARNGSCAQEVDGRCVTEHSSTAWTWAYGSVGIAALAGSAVWLTVSAKRHKQGRRTEVSLSPTGVAVRGTF